MAASRLTAIWLFRAMVLGGAVACGSGNESDARMSAMDIALTEAAGDAMLVDAAMLGALGAAGERHAAGEARAATGVANGDVAPLEALLRGFDAAFDASCVHGNASVDRDGDGVPSRYDAVLACSSDAAGDHVEVTGSVRIVDPDDTDASAGAWMSFMNFRIETSAADGTRRGRGLDGFVSLVDEGGYRVEQNLRVENVLASAAQEQVVWIARAHTSASYHPVGSVLDDPFSRGSLALDGTLTVTTDDGAEALAVRRSAPAISWNRDCRRGRGTGFDAGFASFYRERGGKYEIAFLGCDSEKGSFE